MSAKLTATGTIAGQPPIPPTGNTPVLSVGTVTATTVALNWLPKVTTPGYGWYDVKWGTKSGSYTSTDYSQTTPSTSFTVTGLKTGTPYFFMVQLRQSPSGSPSYSSNEVTATPGGITPPTLINPVLRMTGQHTVSSPKGVFAQKK